MDRFSVFPILHLLYILDLDAEAVIRQLNTWFFTFGVSLLLNSDKGFYFFVTNNLSEVTYLPEPSLWHCCRAGRAYPNKN